MIEGIGKSHKAKAMSAPQLPVNYWVCPKGRSQSSIPAPKYRQNKIKHGDLRRDSTPPTVQVSYYCFYYPDTHCPRGPPSWLQLSSPRWLSSPSGSNGAALKTKWYGDESRSSSESLASSPGSASLPSSVRMLSPWQHEGGGPTPGILTSRDVYLMGKTRKVRETLKNITWVCSSECWQGRSLCSDVKANIRLLCGLNPLH